VKACNRDHIPYILPLRGQLFPWALRHRHWRKQIYMRLVGKRYINGASAIHCTDFLEAEAVLQLGLNPPIFVVPNGIEVSRFDCMPERGHLRERLGISEEAVLLLFLGRLNRIKRPDIAVQVLAATKSLALDVHLLLAGPDEEGLTAMLQAQAQNLGCADRLHITGLLPQDGVLQAFADTDLLLMPSEIQESFGMSALEAMAAGVPILVSEGVPVGRWAEKAGAGRMVPCTAEAFTQATIELLSNIDRLRDMGECGRELAKQKFDISVVARQMLAQYQSIVTNGYPLPDVRENIEDI
jgi:glycosyltransferase involved in cell wall biosynthesis